MQTLYVPDIAQPYGMLQVKWDKWIRTKNIYSCGLRTVQFYPEIGGKMALENVGSFQ